MEKWVMRFGMETAVKPSRPGVWRLKGGGYLVRARAVDPRTKRIVEVKRVLRDVDANEAHRQLRNEIDGVRLGSRVTPRSLPSFAEYALGLFERKVRAGKIRSAKGREKWGYVLEHHLIPAFGELRVDQMTRLDVVEWQASVGERIQAGKVSPRSANTWLSVLRVVVGSLVADYDLERDPVKKIEPFDTSERPTYTEEEPNSLLPGEVGPFLAAIRERHPEYFAMVALGFSTGWRPSTLRALRRRGEACDVLWDQGVILARRSNALGEEVMETTKTKRHQRVSLPEELMDILREHVVALDEEGRRPKPSSRSKSDLLFPSRTGGFLARSCLDKPFADVCGVLGLAKRVTPKAMRRTFQDLARAAEVADVVTRAVSGHATEAMQQHYSSVGAEEMRAELGKVVSLAGLRAARLGWAVYSGGDSGGAIGGATADQGSEKEKGRLEVAAS
jgi:integrase